MDQAAFLIELADDLRELLSRSAGQNDCRTLIPKVSGCYGAHAGTGACPRWKSAETKLVRRQGAAGPRLENGQSIFAEIARRGRACGSLSSQVARRRHVILGEEASPSRSCAARQPIAQLRRNDRRHRQRPRAAKRIEGDQEVMRRARFDLKARDIDCAVKRDSDWGKGSADNIRANG